MPEEDNSDLESNESAQLLQPTTPAQTQSNPIYQRFTNGQKNGILGIVSFVSFIAFFAANCFIPTIREVAHDLGTTTDIVAVSIGVFLFFNGFGSILWARYADFYGRRPIYLVSLPIFIISSVAVAFCQSVGQLMLFRALQSFGVSSFATVGSGTIADIFEVEKRGAALGLYMSAVVMAPAVAPLLGGSIAQLTSWRILQLILAAIGVGCLLLSYAALPETAHPGAKGVKKMGSEWDGKPLFAWKVRGKWVVLLNPLLTLRVMGKPNMALVCLYMSLMMMTSPALLVPIPYLLFKHFGISNESTIGAVCMLIGVGNVVAAPLAGRLSDQMVVKYRKLRGGHRITVDRLRASWYGAFILVPLSLLGFGVLFTFASGPGAMVGILLCLLCNGIGVTMCTSPGLGYIADNLKSNRIEGLAANNAIRVLALSAMSASVLPVIKHTGLLWTFSLIAILAWMGGGVLYILIRLGSKEETVE